MYDLTVHGCSVDGKPLGTVYLPHEPGDSDKIIRLREKMLRDGWQGRAVLMADAGDHAVAFTGCHRLAAVAGLADLEIPVVWLPDDLDADDWDELYGANDDNDRLAALREIATRRDDMASAIEVMVQEIAANEQA